VGYSAYVVAPDSLISLVLPSKAIKGVSLQLGVVCCICDWNTITLPLHYVLRVSSQLHHFLIANIHYVGRGSLKSVLVERSVVPGPAMLELGAHLFLDHGGQVNLIVDASADHSSPVYLVDIVPGHNVKDVWYLSLHGRAAHRLIVVYTRYQMGLREPFLLQKPGVVLAIFTN